MVNHTKLTEFREAVASIQDLRYARQWREAAHRQAQYYRYKLEHPCMGNSNKREDARRLTYWQEQCDFLDKLFPGTAVVVVFKTNPRPVAVVDSIPIPNKI